MISSTRLKFRTGRTTRHTEAYRVYIRIRLSTEARRAAAKRFGLRQELRVHLQTNDRLVFGIPGVQFVGLNLEFCWSEVRRQNSEDSQQRWEISRWIPSGPGQRRFSNSHNLSPARFLISSFARPELLFDRLPERNPLPRSFKDLRLPLRQLWYHSSF